MNLPTIHIHRIPKMTMLYAGNKCLYKIIHFRQDEEKSRGSFKPWCAQRIRRDNFKSQKSSAHNRPAPAGITQSFRKWSRYRRMRRDPHGAVNQLTIRSTSHPTDNTSNSPTRAGQFTSGRMSHERFGLCGSHILFDRFSQP